ncbi:MAG: hypothetical protein COB17_03725 [Sulfurimonas sp.]|nr:MAG: hypothetical protein COB17_03725 [Sulfurimonas sp.]
MISLHDFISKRINTAFLYPAIAAIILFFVLIFFLAFDQAHKNRILIRENILESFSEISKQVVEHFNL